jgi:hypothetical protein
VLFVHDDQAEAVQRREDGRARANDETDVATPDALPLVVPFAVRQRAVLDGDTISKGTAELRGHRRRQRDLGNQHQHLSARLADAIGEAQINFGLPAARDAVQERHMEGVGVG